jgi:hypothetical protein
VAQRVAEEIDIAAMEFEFRTSGFEPPSLVPPPPMSDSQFAAKEQRAVAAVKKNGDLKPLLDMIEPRTWIDGTPYKVNPVVSRLSPATWALVCDLLSGRLKPPRRLGRRPMDKDVRRRINRQLDDAADYVDLIVPFLKRLWPKRQEQDIKSKAIDIAVKQHEIKDRVLLANRVVPSKRDRRTTS